MKIACSFDVFVLSTVDTYGDHNLDIEDREIITSDWLVPPDALEFDPDILESIKQTDEFKRCVPEKWYHVFVYGDLNPEYSYSLEGGKEFDGWVFEDEFISVDELPQIAQKIEEEQ